MRIMLCILAGICVSTLVHAAPIVLDPSALSDPPEGFAVLAAGEQTVDGVTYATSPKALLLREPRKTVTVEVGRKMPTLHLLQAFRPGPLITNWKLNCAIAHRNLEMLPEPPTLYRCYVRYADGKEIEMRVRWNESVEDGVRVGVIPPMLWGKPAITEETGRPEEKRVVYAMEWPNPRPEVRIDSLVIVSANTRFADYGTAVIYAISAGEGDAGRRFYVAPPPLGDDRNEGTFEEPWATPQRAAEERKPGDTAFFRGGTYPLTRHTLLTQDGSPEAPITFSAYPGEIPRFDAATIALTDDNTPTTGGHAHTTSDGAFVLKEVRHVAMRGLRIDNARMHGIKLADCDHVEVAFNRFYRVMNASIGFYGRSYPRTAPLCRGVRIIGNRIVRSCWGEHLTDIEGRHIDKQVNGREALDVSGTTDAEVSHNQISGSYKEGIDPLSRNTRLTVSYNYIHHTWGNGIYNDAWSTVNEGADYYGNVLHDCQGGISLNAEQGGHVRNAKVHHNLIYDCWGFGIEVKGPDTEGIRVHDNTVCFNGHRFGKKKWIVGGIGVLGGGAGDVSVHDNIAYKNTLMETGTAWVPDPQARGIAFERNLTWPEASTPAYTPRNHRGTVVPIALGEDAETLRMEPPFADPAHRDFRLTEQVPGDVGAVPADVPLEQGHWINGMILASYNAGWLFEPVQIPWRCRNARIHHLGTRGVWFTPEIGKHTHDPLQMPTGQVALGGVEWFIPDWRLMGMNTICMLDGYLSTVDDSAIRGIPVGRKAEKVFFLHTYQDGPSIDAWEREYAAAMTNNAKPPAAPVVFRYVVHYADGTRTEIPVEWNRHIARWRQTPDMGDFPKSKLQRRFANLVKAFERHPIDFRPPSEAHVAWSQLGLSRHRGRGPIFVALYCMPWDSPHPQKEIAAIDIVSGNDATHNYGAPALFAITTATRAQ